MGQPVPGWIGGALRFRPAMMMIIIFEVNGLMMIDINVCLSPDSKRGSDMRVTRAQASANRAHVVETASALFRERGYDGVGVADLMAAAGFTHGGFYKQFLSKADLMAEAAACGFEQAAQRAASQTPAEFIAYYLSREHRDHRGAGCTMAALGADASRQTDAVRAAFAQGIEGLLVDIQSAKGDAASPDSGQRSRAETLDTMARLVGALVLSRACPDDSPLADEILDACRGKALGTRHKGNAKAA